MAGRLPQQRFQGLLGVHYVLQPARPADSLMEPCLGVLQSIRHLLGRPKCFRLGRASPVGILTRGFNVPFQGAHKKSEFGTDESSKLRYFVLDRGIREGQLERNELAWCHFGDMVSTVGVYFLLRIRVLQ